MSGALLTCPYLPVPAQALTAACLHPFGRTDRGPAFYEMTLHYAQSHWLAGLPAQALLQVNRALGSAVAPEDAILKCWPLPYAAAAWLLRHHGEGQFIGNPRRHYQHLATRMVEPRKALRTWRAWACWEISRALLPDFPADEKQLESEHIIEPTRDEIAQQLTALGHPGEAALWRLVLDDCSFQ